MRSSSKNNKNKVVKYVIILEVIRVAIYAVMFIYSASMAMLVDFIGLFPIAFIVFPIMIKKDSNNVSSYTPSNSIENDYPEVSVEEYELYDIKNVEEFKTQLYKMFYDIEIAWMNFDYGTLKELCTDELYNTNELFSYTVNPEKNDMRKNSYSFEELNIIISDRYTRKIDNASSIKYNGRYYKNKSKTL